MKIDRTEKYEKELKEAERNIKIADHMANVTYPLLRDPKLLGTIIENIFLAIGKGMSSILLFERTYKRIPPFNDTFDSKLYFFEKKVAHRYRLNKKYLDLIKEIRELMLSHKESTMEFSRRDQYIIWNSEYKIKKVNLDKIKELVRMTKAFISDVDKIIHKKKEYEKPT